MLEWLQTIKDPQLLAIIGAICFAVTEMIMRFTPESFDKKRYAPPISACVGITVALVIGPEHNGMTVFNGLLAGFLAGGGVSGVKSIKTILIGGAKVGE